MMSPTTRQIALRHQSKPSVSLCCPELFSGSHVGRRSTHLDVLGNEIGNDLGYLTEHRVAEQYRYGLFWLAGSWSDKEEYR